MGGVDKVRNAEVLQRVNEGSSTCHKAT